MASLLKLASLPRLQLLVVMLVLVAGLFPEKSVADEEPASASDAAEGSAPAAPADASGGSSNGTAVGRAEKTVQCYKQDCPEKGGSSANCLSPDFSKLEKVDCKTGYCYSNTGERESGITAKRGCADETESVCLAELSERCYVQTSSMSKEEIAKNFKTFLECVQRQTTGKGRAEADMDYKHAECVCDTDLCNTRTSSGPTGAKHLGYNVGLLGALLVAVFPLRTMFLS